MVMYEQRLTHVFFKKKPKVETGPECTSLLLQLKGPLRFQIQMQGETKEIWRCFGG